MRLTSFHKAESNGELAEMIALYRAAMEERENTGFETLHAMNAALSERCAKRGILRIIRAPGSSFAARELPEPLRTDGGETAISPDGLCFAKCANYSDLERGDMPTMRSTHKRRIDMIMGGDRCQSVCIGQKEEIYAALVQEKKFQIACLGRNLSDDETVLEIRNPDKDTKIKLIGVTSDSRFLLFSLRNEAKGSISVDLLDMRGRKVVSSFAVGDIANAKKALTSIDTSLCMLQSDDTALELMWDYDPVSFANVSVPHRLPNNALIEEQCPSWLYGSKEDRVGKALIKYYDEADVKSYIIPEGIAAIGFNAFKGCDALRSVIIPESVVYINGDAFADCKNLESVIIQGHGLKLIGKEAFAGCSALSEFRMEACELRAIFEGTFSNCSSLTRFVVPEGVEKIDQFAFRGSGLEECILPGSVRELGKGAFAQTKLTQIRIPAAVEALPDDAFALCGCLAEIRNEGSIRAIGCGALSGCDSLERVEVAMGAVVYKNMFSVYRNSWSRNLMKNDRKRTVTKATKVARYSWDSEQQAYVAQGKVEIVPVSRE